MCFSPNDPYVLMTSVKYVQKLDLQTYLQLKHCYYIIICINILLFN